MFSDMDENLNSKILDFSADSLGFDGVVLDSNSDQDIDLLQDYLTSPWSMSIEAYLAPISTEELSSNIVTNRKEWLVEDAISKRLRSPRLFEFLVLLLKKPQYKLYASFTDGLKGIFQIHEPEKVAELWQMVKSRQSNQKMTYDKLARAIRWYYKSNIMQKTNTRYTFQFSSRVFNTFFTDENESGMSANLPTLDELQKLMFDKCSEEILTC